MGFSLALYTEVITNLSVYS